MPATEQTWRNQKLLHRVFAVSGVLLLISTIWMFVADHNRPWKPYQRTANNVEIQMTNWRELQFQTEEQLTRHRRLEERLEAARAQMLDEALLDRFQKTVQSVAVTQDYNFEPLRGKFKDLADAAYRATAATTAGDDPQAEAKARAEAAQLRAGALDDLRSIIRRARFREDRLLGQRKFKAADRDKAIAELGLLVRDEKPLAQQEDKQADIDQLIAEFRQLTADYDAANNHRKELQKILAEMTRDEDEAAQDVEDSESELESLRTANRERRSTFVNWWGPVPLPGKRWLELPILDAFNSPRKIDNLWSDDLEIDYNFAKVRRFDRCTTCHQLIDKTQPGSATDPAYVHSQDIDYLIAPTTLLSVSLPDAIREQDGTATYQVELSSPTQADVRVKLDIGGTATRGTDYEVSVDDEVVLGNEIVIPLGQSTGSITLTAKADNETELDETVTIAVAGVTNAGYTGAALELTAAITEDPEAKPQPQTVADRDTSATSAAREQADPARLLEQRFGLLLAPEGLLEPTDVTVQFVRPQSLAALAEDAAGEGAESRSGAEISGAFMQGARVAAAGTPPGLLVGDVIYMIDGRRMTDVDKTRWALIDAAQAGQPVNLTIRRGLQHPYTSHPRLDLFVGSLSPHKMSEFACTICHEGQGSATAFKWASHMPNSERQRQDWMRDHGWFDNPHWIFPMFPKRFAESSCLKCHHDVASLEASPRYPDPPAPKLTQGYHYIRKYGCFGCHEINGYDGPKRIGPDLRIEPNVFAAAAQLKTDPAYSSLSDEARDWVQQLIEHPERDGVRRRMYELLVNDQASDPPRFSDETHAHLTPLFKDVERPGTLRKAGPSLRYVGSKLPADFMYDWIREPKHFRPGTRMPQFFGLWDHIEGESEELARRYEPIEILGMVSYLQQTSQEFAYLEPAAAGDAARGKTAFQTRGCLACHDHNAFPDAEPYRPPGTIVQGPDLSGMGDKLKNEDGAKWLYTWINQPTRYHARTVMPDLFLTPQQDAEGNVVDPAADIVAFLLTSSVNWSPAAGTLTSVEMEGLELAYQENADTLIVTYGPDRWEFDVAQPSSPEPPLDVLPDAIRDTVRRRLALDELCEDYLRDTFSAAFSKDFQRNGIPESFRGELKGVEIELIVDAASPHTPQKKLGYIGRKAIAKYGCYGCHDVPGFEDAKPIGTGLADWGRKDPSKLAFEHITHLLEERHRNGHVGHGPHDDADKETREFYEHQVEAGHRTGFIYQKLLEPRSYDYHKTENKKYNERLRMPQFPFQASEREAIITFVLGLVADPPAAKYVYRPDERTSALIAGRKALEKYNCGGCHLLEAPTWKISYPRPFEEQLASSDNPVPLDHDLFSTLEVAASAQPDPRTGMYQSLLTGMPAIDPTARTAPDPIVYDSEFEPLEKDLQYDPQKIIYGFQLWEPALLSGHFYQPGIQTALEVPASWITDQRAGEGGMLARYLLPHVFDLERQVNSQANPGEAWAWVPPPLIGQGNKVQTEWLHDFLLNPYPIRPAVFLRMPRFNMSSAEATAIANYFAARDNANYPYQFAGRRQAERLEKLAAEYQQRLPADAAGRTRFGDAMKIVIDKANGCAKCHRVADYEPEGGDRAKAPNLAQIYTRMQPDYLYRWIAYPKGILPYTTMPVNIKYDANSETLGGVSQDMYHGTSVQQLDGLVDLLMNFDEFAKQRSLVTPLVTGEASPNAPAVSLVPSPVAPPRPADEPKPTPAPTDTTAQPLPEFLKNLPPADGWGDLTVRFVYDGLPPPPAAITADKDTQYCGTFDLRDESLVVNPENKAVANVFAYLYLQRGQERIPIHPSYLEQARKQIVLDNAKCRFEPHAALLWTPQTLAVGNSDPVGHNVKIDTLNNPATNNSLPAMSKLLQQFDQAERVPTTVSCSIHTWMKSYVLIRDNPYFALSDKDGQMAIKNLPSGDWTIQFWHERSGYVDQVSIDGQPVTWSRGRVEVKIENGKATELGTVTLGPALFED